MSKTILLVEDSETDEKLARLAFRACGVENELVVVRDGAEALDYLLGGVPRPAPTLVLLDLGLPRVDGHEVLRRVRADARTSRLPVVIFTSSSQDEDIARSHDLGASAHVRKPADFAELTAAAAAIGRFWLLLNELPPTRSAP